MVKYRNKTVIFRFVYLRKIIEQFIGLFDLSTGRKAIVLGQLLN